MVPVSAGVAVEVDPKGVAEIKPAGTANLDGTMDMVQVGMPDMVPVGTADMDGAKGADLALSGVVAEGDTKIVPIRLPRPSFRTCCIIMLL